MTLDKIKWKMGNVECSFKQYSKGQFLFQGFYGDTLISLSMGQLDSVKSTDVHTIEEDQYVYLEITLHGEVIYEGSNNKYFGGN